MLHINFLSNQYNLRRWLISAILLCSLLPLTKAYSNDGLQSLLTQFSPYDFNGDGTPEIDALSYLPFENPNEQIPTDANLVLVLVEPRILEDIPGSPFTTDDLHNRLKQFKGDLRAEGYYTRFISTQVYDSTRHQDGRTVLAIRAFFQQVQSRYSNFKGSILVGSFPEAMLVREWLHRTDNNTLVVNGIRHDNASFLQIIPQIIAERAELVLADLNGNWQDIYHENPTGLLSIQAIPTADVGNIWPADNAYFSSNTFIYEPLPFQDFFYIKDDNYEVISYTPGAELTLRMFTGLLHPEMNNEDKALPNPMARPDIFVSRINPRHIAVNPDPSFLDATGKPQPVADTTHLAWRRDASLERHILIDYFDRNHDFRVGAFSNLPFRPAGIGKDFNAGDVDGFLRAASGSFDTSRLIYENATLLDYVNWLKQPAILRGIATHSNSIGSYFGIPNSPAELEAAVGGRPWNWIQQAGQWVPGLDGQSGEANWSLHRTLWENKALTETGANLFVHRGCYVNTPAGAAHLPYNDPQYGNLQNGEGVLFYLNGVATISRAKEFYDLPDGLPQALARDPQANFGEGWRAYFDADARDSTLKDRKRPYFWSVLGDWTVRLKNENGIGILSYQNGNIQSSNVHPNNAWIESWNFISNRNTIKGKGDFNGDGLDDFLVTSEWGLGILYNNGTEWKQLMLAPKDTWFGQWHYNMDDKIESISDFNEDGRDDILISGSSGIGILTFDGNTSTLISLVTHSNGTRFPLLGNLDQGWLYNADIIAGVGNFNNDTKPDILITSPWGIGLLTLENNFLSCLMLQPKGTRFGGWLYWEQDRIQGIGRFNGDERDDILITSQWGIGILTLHENTFTSLMLQPTNTMFGEWLYTQQDKIQGIGDFNGDSRKDVLVSNSSGLGMLTLTGSTMTSLMAHSNGTRFSLVGYPPDHGWLLNTEDNTISGIGNFDGDDKASDDLLISSPWGIGLLTLSGNTLSAFHITPYQSKLGKWYLQSQDVIVGIGNFDRQPGIDVLIQKKTVSPLGFRTSTVSEDSPTETRPEDQSVYQTKVYPNPYSQATHVWVNSPEQEPVTIKIIDMQGKEVYTSFEYKTNEEITLGDKLNRGIYLLQVICKAKTEILRIVKIE